MDKWLENDTVVKIIAVVLALVIWLQANNAASVGTQTQRTVDAVSVSWRDLPADLAVQSVSPSSVNITVRGASQQILSLTNQSVGAIVDLKGATAGRIQFPVYGLVPPGVQNVGTTPQYATVVLEPIIDRSKPVTVQVAGTPADGYRAGAGISSPATVLVHGPQSEVDRVVSVVASANVGGATGDQVATVTPHALDGSGKPVTGITLVPSVVQVAVPVRQAVATRSLPVSVTVRGKPAAGYTVAGTTATPSSVTVSGPSTTLAALSQVATAPVSVAGAKADVSMKATLVLPNGVTSVSPSQVAVVVHITNGQGGSATGTATTGRSSSGGSTTGG
jgi:YbbR domain-containing protein